jgi:hypothetical protein
MSCGYEELSLSLRAWEMCGYKVMKGGLLWSENGHVYLTRTGIILYDIIQQEEWVNRRQGSECRNIGFYFHFTILQTIPPSVNL